MSHLPERKENYKLLKLANVSQVKGLSFEANGDQAENFLLLQEFSRDKKRLSTKATTADNVTTITTSYYENDRIKKTVDSLVTVSTTTEYEYDAAGRPTRIISRSADPEHDGSSTEEHVWFYKENGTPDRMFKIKNQVDTVKVSFVYDEKGNLAEEKWQRKNTLPETYYYYYNDNKQLTDIVRYDARSKKLLPDLTFDYDANGRTAKMLQKITGTYNYVTWHYTYEENGLRKKEVCFDKSNRVLGRIEYTYSR